MSIASAALPAKPEKCFCVATIQVQAKTPTTIDGVPFSTSATKRVTQVEPAARDTRRSRCPAPMPTGRPMRHAVPTISSVPTIAWATPPPVSPAGAGILVKKSSERLPAPLSTRSPRMKKSGSTATTTRQIMSPTMTLLTSRRSDAAVHSALLPAPEPRATRQISSRAPAFTSTVTTKSRNAT